MDAAYNTLNDSITALVKKIAADKLIIDAINTPRWIAIKAKYDNNFAGESAAWIKDEMDHEYPANKAKEDAAVAVMARDQVALEAAQKDLATYLAANPLVASQVANDAAATKRKNLYYYGGAAVFLLFLIFLIWKLTRKPKTKTT